MKILICTIATSKEKLAVQNLIETVRFGFAKHLFVFIDELPQLELRNNYTEAVLKKDCNINSVKQFAIEYANENEFNYVCFLPVNTLIPKESNWLVSMAYMIRNISSPGLIGVLNQDTDYDLSKVPDLEFDQVDVLVSTDNSVEGVYLFETKTATRLGGFNTEIDLGGYADMYLSKKMQLDGKNNVYVENEFCYSVAINSESCPNKKNIDCYNNYQTSIKDILQKRV